MNGNQNSLVGQTALVTGSSSGIGLATARLLASRGAKVILHGGQSAKKLAEAAESIKPSGTVLGTLLADLSHNVERAKLIDDAWHASRGGLDILVNCAGADVLTGDNAKLSFSEKLTLLWQIDVQGTVELSRAVGAKMKARGRGAVVHIGWDQAAFGMGGDSGELFSLVKGAVTAFSLSLAKSLAPHVRVNVVAPGWIKTAWGESASPAWQKRATEESLLKRWGTSDDVATAIAFLASPESSFITGQVLPVNGGFAGTFSG
jgi:3-oxoacyl-[acyl-carrier protein] reductase